MGPSYTPIPYDGGDSTSIPPVSPIQDASSTTATVPRRSIANRHCNCRLHRYANRKLRSSKLFELSGPSYTPIPYDGGDSTSIPPVSPIQDASSTTATVPRRSIANRHCNCRLHRYANRKLRSSKLFELSGPSYTPIPYDGGDSTSIPPVSPIQDASSTTATVPRRSIANRHCNCRLHRYANRKLRSSKLFELSGPSYTPIPYDGGDSTSIPPVSPIQDASSTTATVPRRSIANRHVNRRLHRYAKRKLRSSKLFELSGPSYTPIPYDGGDSPSIPPVSPIQDASSTTATVPRRSIANRHVNRRLHRYAKRKLRSSKLFELSGPSYTPIPYDGGDSPSIPPVSPIQDASSTTATVPRRSIANRHVNRRLHRYAKRKLRSSKLFELSGPSYTPIPYDGGDSPSIPPVSPIQDASSTTATVPRRSIANRHVNRRLHRYAKRKLRSSKLFELSGPSYTPIPYDGGDSTSRPPVSPIQDASSTTATVPRRSIANRHVNRRLLMYANRKLRSSKLFELSGPSYTPIPYDGGDSTSIPPVSPIQDASSTTATVPRRSIANRHVNRRLRMYANRQLRSSKLFERSGPSYTPYHMMAESRPLNLLLRLMRASLRLQRRYHADPLPTGTSILVC